MSEDPSIKGEFIFDELSENATMSGILVLTSKESLLLDGVDLALYLETRGRISSQRSNIFGFTIALDVHLEKNIPLEIPFQHSFNEYNFETYIGKNVSFSYSCEATLRVNEADVDKVDIGIYEKMMDFIFAESPYIISRDFELRYPNYEYQVVESSGNFDIKSGSIPAIISIILGVIATLILLNGGFVDFLNQSFKISISDSGSHFFLGVFLFLFLSFVLQGIVYIFYKLFEMRLGSVQVEVLKSNNGFKCTITKPDNFKLENQQIWYDIVEVVEDNRGTSSSTYTEVVHFSPKSKISDFNMTKEVELKFPERTGLESKTLKDVNIYWELIFSGNYKGLNVEYRYKFDVETAKF